MTRRWIVVLLVSIQALLVGWIGKDMCPNKTEISHMGAAAYFWQTLQFDVFRVNPPLTRMIVGIPVLLCNPNYDWSSYSSRPQDRCEGEIGRAFIDANGFEKTRRCFILARWSLIPLLLLGGYFGYRLSRETYGDSAGFVFLALWCFSPLVLAWGATICPDAVGGALGLIAVYTFHQWLHKPNGARVAIAGVCLGLLPLTKLTWIIAFAIWPLIWCIWTAPIHLAKADKQCLSSPPLGQLMAMLLIGLYTLNMGYMFDGTFRPLGKYVFISQSLGGHPVADDQPVPVPGNRFAGTWAGMTPVPLPADFVQGTDTQRLDFERGMASYLRGEWSNHGWWYYYLYVLLVKMPLGTWYLVFLAILCSVFQKEYRAAWRDEILILLPFFLLFLFVSSQTGFSEHPRYILPALPFFFLAISRVGKAFTLKRPAVAKLAVIAIGCMVASSMSVYPHSLSYFNELAAVLPTQADASYPMPIGKSDKNGNLLSTIISAGPRHGPRHLLGSNLDWGQDLFYLEEWCRSHPEARPMRVAYFGNYPLDRTDIKSKGTPSPGPANGRATEGPDASSTEGPAPGWYALSVNEIYEESRQYRYFLNFWPVATMGFSIHIYHITLDEANRVRREMGLRELKDAKVKTPKAAQLMRKS
jgi:hypothetical protein